MHLRSEFERSQPGITPTDSIRRVPHSLNETTSILTLTNLDQELNFLHEDLVTQDAKSTQHLLIRGIINQLLSKNKDGFVTRRLQLPWAP